MKIKIEVPHSLADITLGQYQEYQGVVETNKEDDNAQDFLDLKALEIFCGLDVKESLEVPMKHFIFALEHLSNCFQEKTPMIRHFKFRDSSGKEQAFGMIPNLQDISSGEYFDIDKYIGNVKDYHRLMAVLFRPVTHVWKERYELEPYTGTDKWAEDMRKMPLNIAIGAVVFFYRLGMKLSAHTAQSLSNQGRLQTSNSPSQLDGDGILHSLQLLNETTLQLMRQQLFHYTKP